MNTSHFNLTNLSVSDLICSEKIINIGGTLTGKWGYVWKVTDIDLTSRTAIIDLLYYGDVVDTKVMKDGDRFNVTDPSNSESKHSMLLNYVQSGKEASACFFTSCFWTQQYSKITMLLDLPSSVTDGQSYTVSGRITKDRLNETLETPIVNEKVYITESGTNIIETITDSDGVFSLTFTYHINNNYEIYYPGRIDVTSIIKMLNATTIPGSTHLMTITFNEVLPDFAITAFNSISNPVESVIQILNDKGTIGDLTGWELKNIQINKKQIIVYLKDMSIVNVSRLSYIKTLNVGDVIAKILAAAVVGATIGMLLGAIFPPAEPFTFTAGLLLGILVGIFSQWKVIISLLVNLPGYIIGSIFGTSDKDSTTKEVNENAKEFLNVKLKECEDTYNLSTKDSAACIIYAECMKNTYANFQEYTQGYLFQKVSTSLTLNSKNLKSAIDIKCINKFKAGEIRCADLITCTTNEGNDFISQGDTIIYKSYPKDSPYTPPWEENGNGGNFLKNVLIIGGLITVGYIGYKVVSKKN